MPIQVENNDEDTCHKGYLKVVLWDASHNIIENDKVATKNLEPEYYYDHQWLYSKILSPGKYTIRLKNSSRLVTYISTVNLQQLLYCSIHLEDLICPEQMRRQEQRII